MTVAELIARLHEMPQDLEVLLETIDPEQQFSYAKRSTHVEHSTWYYSRMMREYRPNQETIEQGYISFSKPESVVIVRVQE